MRTLTHNELVTILASAKGMLIVGLLTLTDARCRKKNNPLALPIYKVVRAIGFVGSNYGASVNREANRQGASPSFDSQPLVWGEWLIPGKVITHNGGLYLRTQTTPGTRRNAPCKVLSYRDAQGRYVAKSKVLPYLPLVKESAKQQGQTGIVQTVWVRTYAFHSIQRIRIKGQTFKLVPDIAPNFENQIESFLMRD